MVFNCNLVSLLLITMGNKEIRNLRITLLIFAVIMPISAINIAKLNPNFYDPLWIRVLFSIKYLLFLFGTYKIKWVINNHQKIGTVFAYILTFFQTYLMISNNCDRSYVSGYVFLCILVLLYLKSISQVLIYSIFTFILLIVIYNIYYNPDFEDGIKPGHLRFLFIMNFIFTLIQIYGIKREKNLKAFSDKLNKSEEKYKNLLESAPDGIVTLDEEGLITAVNHRVCELFNYSNDELIGKKLDLLVPLESNKEKMFAVEKFIKFSKTKDLISAQELNAKKKEGVFFPVEINLTPIIDDESRVIIAIIRDITKRIESEKELNEIKLKLQQKELAEKISQAKSEFISKMSHEIRTPLNGIYGFTNILLKEKLSSDQKKYIENIKFSSEILTVLINDILDNTNLETGNISLELNELDIKKIIENVIESFKVRLNEKNISISLAFSEHNVDEELKPLGDFLRISQILMNLLSNAIKFSEINSKIEIKAELNYSDESTYELVLSVTDFGIGIPKDKLEDIFQPYIQVSSVIAKKYGGNGLGLSIVKSLVDKMKGTISVESGDQTTFCVKIPLDKSKHIEKDSIGTVKIDQDQIDKLNVLIVEDNLMNQFLMKTILGNMSIKHDVAENGVFALKMLEDKHYDIIFMDIMMPEMDGLTCTKIIKQEKQLDSYIVALTADVKTSIDKDVIDLFDGYIKKPFEQYELIQQIDLYLKKTATN